MCTCYPIINRVSELKVHIELTRFVQPEKIEIDANERAVNEKSQYCFFVCTTFDSFLNDLFICTQRFLRMVSSVFCPELRRQSQPQQFLSTSLSFSFDLIWLIFSYTSSILNFSYHRFLSLRDLPSRLIFSYDFQPTHPNMTFQGKHLNTCVLCLFPSGHPENIQLRLSQGCSL